MDSSKSLHVVPGVDGGWRVLRWGASRAWKKFVTKEEAVAWGRTRSRSLGAELFIHRYDGGVQERIANGADTVKRRNGNAHAEQADTHGRGRE
jgi:hypothetical protein